MSYEKAIKVKPISVISRNMKEEVGPNTKSDENAKIEITKQQ
jgi:hypothetical protein